MLHISELHDHFKFNKVVAKGFSGFRVNGLKPRVGNIGMLWRYMYLDKVFFEGEAVQDGKQFFHLVIILGVSIAIVIDTGSNYQPANVGRRVPIDQYSG